MAARREARQVQMFDKVDSDGSGEVSSTELQGALDDIAAKSGNSAGDAKDLLTQYDTDGDGSLSQDELGSALKSVLPAPPSTMEFAQARGSEGQDTPGPPGPGVHHGGGGGRAEGSSGSSGSYDPLDTDQDGTVSAAELAAAGVSSTDGSGGTDALASLFQAVDSDGKISESESDVLMQKIEAALSSISSGSGTTSATSTASTGTDASATDTQDGARQQAGDPHALPPPFDLNRLAQMVLQQYTQVANNSATSSTAGSTVSAVA